MIIRSKTFEQWLRANFYHSELEDITNHGCASGFPGLTYYSDTVKLFERFKDEIFDLLVEESEALGYDNIYQFMASFNAGYMPSDYTTFANQMTWYAAETYARRIVEED